MAFSGKLQASHGGAGGKRFAIRDWLERVKEGYGERFSSAFEEVGVEDEDDLTELAASGADGAADAEALEALERALQASGARPVQLQKIRRALGEVSNSRSRAQDARNTDEAVVAAAAPAASPAAASRAPMEVSSVAAPPPAAKDKVAVAEAAKPYNPELWRSVFAARVPGKPSVAPRPGSVTPAPTSGYVTMRDGDGPRLYFVHDIDGDPFGPGATFRALPEHLGNCHCVALAFDEDARACSSLQALASLHVLRILQDLRRAPPGRRAHIVGYSMGCILAQEVAAQLRQAGGQVGGLLLLGSEIVWPAPDLPDRMGRYPWLGGELEAALKVVRSWDAVFWAEQEVNSLLASDVKERDPNRLNMRAYWKVAGPNDMPYEDFMHAVTAGAENMDDLYQLMRDYAPPPGAAFVGPALLLLAPDSPEFHVAEDVNRGFLSDLQVAFGMGSHYTMLSPGHARVAANALLSFLRAHGEKIDMSTAEAQAPSAALSSSDALSLPRSSRRLPATTLSEVSNKILSLLNEQVLEPVDLDSSLLAAGMDSISLSLVATQLYRDLGVQLTAARMMDFETVGELSQVVHSLLEQQRERQPRSAEGALASPPPRPSPPPTPALPAVAGLTTLQAGDGPRIYMVHGIDGDMFNSGASYSAVAPMLAPCFCAALLYDDEAFRASTLSGLAEVYVRRVLEDSRRHPGRSVFVAGYSFGCVIAHQMALQLEARGSPASLLLIDFEVTFPPAPAMSRLGGYEWLGGPAEATLLFVRSSLGMEGIQWAEKEALALLEQRAEDRDAPGLQRRAFEFVASKRKGMRLEDLKAFSDRGGRNMDRIRSITGTWAPPRAFGGECLLVLAPDSADFQGAREVNAKYCSRMEVQQALGTHYSIIQPQYAAKAAGHILNFLRRLGHQVPEAPTVPDVPGLVTLSEGDGPRLYMVHGIDGDMYSPGSSYAALAPLLAPCNACSLVYDDEALRCDSLPALAGLYLGRAYQDAQRSPSAPVVFVGYSFGCVIAHLMALLAQGYGMQVTLVLIDFEVTYPIAPSPQRLGGYEWLGGDFEVALLLARSSGGIAGVQWAEEETKRLLALPPGARDSKAFQKKVFDEVASNKKGFRREDFDRLCDRGGRAMERIHTTTGKWRPTAKFEGEALLVMAPMSTEFHAAIEVNKEFCSKMEIVFALGTHYSILQASLAPKAASAILAFLRRLGFAIPAAPPALPRSPPGLATLHEGEGGAPKLYVVHGLDGDALSDGRSPFAAVAPLLGACASSAFSFDGEAFREAESMDKLARLYADRTMSDWTPEHLSPLVFVGVSAGCALALRLAAIAREHQVPADLVLLDFEASSPTPSAPSSSSSSKRLGGYPWLGGDVEATLYWARSSGSTGEAWAQREVERLLAQPVGSRNCPELRQRALRELGASTGPSSASEVEGRLERAGRNMERLHSISSSPSDGRRWMLPRDASGSGALHICARGSEEFRAAAAANNQLCEGGVEVVEAPGTHYSMLAPENASSIAGLLLGFLRRRGHAHVPEAPGAPPQGGTPLDRSAE